MTPAVLEALLAAVGSLGVASIAAVGVILGLLWRRIAHLEEQVRQRDEYNRKLWIWARALLDYYFRYRRENSPDPPDPPRDEELTA